MCKRVGRKNPMWFDRTCPSYVKRTMLRPGLRSDDTYRYHVSEAGLTSPRYKKGSAKYHHDMKLARYEFFAMFPQYGLKHKKYLERNK